MAPRQPALESPGSIKRWTPRPYRSRSKLSRSGATEALLSSGHQAPQKGTMTQGGEHTVKPNTEKLLIHLNLKIDCYKQLPMDNFRI